MVEISKAMNEAVSAYNATTNFNADINVAYHPGVPTAESNYLTEIKFGGLRTTQAAIHEIAHYLGSGTYGSWWGNFDGGGVWIGPALRRYIKLFDGPGAEIRQSGVHYYPYGFNYGSEDSPNARYRIGRIVQAMRQDMGISNGDGNGISDEWERDKMGFTQPAAGDADGDGISNYDEWWTDSHPMWACPVKSGHIYQLRSRLSQKLLEAADTTAGANVRQNPNDGSDLQKWTATYVSGGYWKFTNLASGKALEVIGFSTDPSANIIAWNDTGGTNQQWRIFSGASGAAYWKMGNRNSTNTVVDVDGGPGATGDNANIAQYFDDLNAFNQDWFFDDVTPGVLTDGLVANYKFEGNPRDFGGRNFHGTASGGISYTPGRIDGLAATFNGTTGSISIPATVERNFSLACWVKTTATAGTGQWYNGMGLIDADVGGVAKDFGLAMLGNKAAFGVGNPEVTITSSNAINDGNWHHIAATFDAGNGAMKLYVDGVVRGTGSGPASPRSAPATFTLGSVGPNAGFLNGSLDEARLYNKVISQDEINRLVNTGQSLVASYSFDGDSRDATLFDNHGDGVGVTYAPGKIGSQAVQLNGTTGFVKLPAPVTSDFSIAYWVKTTQTGGIGQWWAGKSMIDADIPGVANDWGIALVGDKAGFGVGNAGSGDTILSTTAINNGAWHHVVATRINSTGAMKLYVDGALQASGVGSNALRSAPNGIRVGSTLYGGTYFAGAIDDLKIFNYALASSQVAALGSTIPAPWTAADVGNPASDGYAGYSSGGVFTVVGGGSDIGGTSDQFQFVSSAQSGSQSVSTRVTAVPSNARAGLMFRNTTAADSPFVGLVYENPAGLRFLRRDAAGATATQVGSTVPVALPFWLKMTRASNSFTAFYATVAGTPAESDWIVLGSQTTALAAAPLAGLAVTSRTTGQVATATFANLSISPTRPDELWRQQYFGTIVNAGNAADNMDPDADTLSNLLERALGLNPNVTNLPAERPTLGLDGGFLSLAYTRSLNATDLSIGAKWSNDLAVWSNTGVIDELISTNGTVESRVAKAPLSNVDPLHAFIRLEIH